MLKCFGQIFDLCLAGRGWVGKQRGRCTNLKTKFRPHAQRFETTNKEQFPRYFISKGLGKANKGKTLRMMKSIDLHVVVFVVEVVVVVAVSVVAVVESFAAEEYTNINLLTD